jgi:tRNA-dihydrouridine synthase A
LVAKIAETMMEAAKVPVSIKCRIGINETVGFEFVHKFIDTSSFSSFIRFLNSQVRKVGVKRFIVHARPADLKMTTEDNRKVPPLDYEVVFQLVKVKTV